jgi:glucose/arabinose dehydrogenase
MGGRSLPLAAVLAAGAVLALASCGDDGVVGPVAVAGAPSTAAGAAVTRAPSLLRIGTFSGPVYVTSPPGDKRRLFVVERAGRIRVIRGGKTLGRAFLDIRDLVTDAYVEQGLLSLAFAPDYAKTGRFYVYYTGKDAKERVVEYRRATADIADPTSARPVLVMDDPEANHNGGLLQFGPDGLLYIGTGDGGGANDQHGARGNAQNLDSLLGKLLRIDPRASGGKPYRIPPSNPFVSRTGTRPEIYSYGLRNPWRYSFDAKTDALVIADVGQDAVEEVDYASKGAARGANYGWRPLEGTRVNFAGESAPGAVAPVVQQQHSDGWCSITGGYVVRDPKVPALAGRYIYGDFCQTRLHSVKLSAGRARSDQQLSLRPVEQLSSFGQDASGRIYVVSLAGPVYRLVQR